MFEYDACRVVVRDVWSRQLADHGRRLRFEVVSEVHLRGNAVHHIFDVDDRLRVEP